MIGQNPYLCNVLLVTLVFSTTLLVHPKSDVHTRTDGRAEHFQRIRGRRWPLTATGQEGNCTMATAWACRTALWTLLGCSFGCRLRLPCYAFTCLPAKRSASAGAVPRRTTRILLAHEDDVGGDDDDNNDHTFLPLLQLASAHCASQAVSTAIQLGIPDILLQREQEQAGDIDNAAYLDLPNIAAAIGPSCHQDTLLRILRLLTTVNILTEKEVELPARTVAFALTKMGRALTTTSNDDDKHDDLPSPSMASCFLHWMERPLWNTWLELPEFISSPCDPAPPSPPPASSSAKNTQQSSSVLFPFDRANHGISSDYWYNAEDHPESLYHANQFVRLIHDREIQAMVQGFDWSGRCSGQRVVDIGGHHGQLMSAIAQTEPSVDCYSLDLPNVIVKAPPEKRQNDSRVTLVAGDVFDTDTIPQCDTILMKHFLDRCMWTEQETIDILKSCQKALSRSYSADNEKGGKLIIAEAVLPDYGKVTADNQLPLYLDALYALVGRKGQRTRQEWECVALAAGFEVDYVQHTNVPSCSLIMLTIKT